MQFLDRYTTAIKFLCDFLHDPASHTYYPQSQQKSNLHIYLDNLWWLLKYREINHFYYMYGLDQKGASQKDYLAKKVFFRLRNKVNSAFLTGGRRSNYICLLRDKFIFANYLKALGFPTPQILALCDKDSITWLDNGRPMALESISATDCDVFIKEILGECADGVYAVKVKEKKIYINEHEATIEQLKETIKGMCIVQQRVCQHPKLSQLYPYSVNTIRLVTAMTNKNIVPLGAIIRLGTNKQTCDNLAIGGLSVPIDIQTGALKKIGMFRPAFGRRTESHPDTGVRFDGFVIPFFDSALNMAIGLHAFFYGIHSIGWDIAITPTGPVFVEGNDNWEIPTLQAHNPDFGEKYLATITQP